MPQKSGIKRTRKRRFIPLHYRLTKCLKNELTPQLDVCWWDRQPLGTLDYYLPFLLLLTLANQVKNLTFCALVCLTILAKCILVIWKSTHFIKHYLCSFFTIFKVKWNFIRAFPKYFPRLTWWLQYAKKGVHAMFAKSWSISVSPIFHTDFISDMRGLFCSTHVKNAFHIWPLFVC